MSDSASLDIEDPSALAQYLRATSRIAQAEQVTISILAGGVSNKTVLVRRSQQPDWVLKQALPKLRVAADWFSDPARIGREALGLVWLGRLAPLGTITPLVFEDPAHHLLAMHAVPDPHENWKSMLLAGRVQADHVAQFGRLLGQIHRHGHERSSELRAIFDDRSFFESLRIEPYYAFVASRVPEAASFLKRLTGDTRARRFTLVHGDYSPKNILVHHGRLILLDHEVIHFGDPAFDLGFALTHLLSKAHHLPEHREAFRQGAGQFWQAYRDTLGDVPWGSDLEAYAVRHALGCLLARVAGRSPLEYLAPTEREHQRRAITQLMNDAPETVANLTARFP